MTFAITAPYAAVLTLILILLNIGVTRLRIQTGISLGDGGNPGLLQAIRRHANFCENVPLAVILLALAEAQATSPLVLNGCGLALVVARVVQPFGLWVSNAQHPARIAGGLTTTAVQFVLAVTLAFNHFA